MKTYNLQEFPGVACYYERTKKLANAFDEQTASLDKIADQYRAFINSNKIEHTRSKTEYKLEIVYLFILHQWIQSLLKRNHCPKGDEGISKVMESTAATLAYMQSSGEFKEEIYRLQNWMAFFRTLEEEEKDCLHKALVAISIEIEREGDKELYPYIIHLSDYLKKVPLVTDGREDEGLILRDKNCYYINMIGAQVFNNCYREDFQRSSLKYVFLPGCMAVQKDKCQAQEDEKGFRCVHCTDGCQINRLSTHYENVRIMYHGSQIEKKNVDPSEQIGVIGVSCVLNLIAGGFKAKRLGYVPQCVILNHCGCTMHWSRKGEVTRIDEEELASFYPQETA